MSSTDGELLEREDESNLLAAQLAAAAAGTGCVVWIEGPAGVGKTSLLGVAARRAHDRQMLVLRGTGHEPERLYPFGVVRQLFEQAVRGLSPAERGEVFAGAAAKARPLVDVQVEPSPHAREPAVFFHALYWLTAALATTSPVAILVDDLQWVDEESAAFLAYLGRRIEDLPVALFAASRPLDPDPAAPTFSEVRGTATLEVVARELSLEATAALVARLLLATGGAESVDPGFAEACHRVTGGNPFYLGELARALREAEVTPTAAGVLRVQQVESSELVRTVLRRVGNLGADANAVARALAVLGNGASVRHVAAVAELPESEVAAAADRLAASGILANGLPLRFAHPIVEVAVDREDKGARRAERHARAATVLLADGAPAESVARHLLEIEPHANAQAGEVLDEAARRALAVGGAAAALRYLERALREPAAAETARRHYQAGLAARLAGDAAASVSHLESAVGLCPDSEERVAMTLELANAYHVVRRLRDAIDLLTEAIEAAPNHDALLAFTAGLAGVAISAADYRRVTEPLEALAATLTGTTAVGRELLVHLATVRIVTGVALPRRVIGLVKKAVAAGVVADTTADRPTVTWAGTWLLAADELDLALTVAEEAVADAQLRGSLLGYGVATTLRAQVLLARGDIAGAEADAVAAYDAVRSAGWRVGIEQTAGALATVLVERGRLDEVFALVREHEHDRSYAALTLLIAQAQALLAQGRAAEALGILEPLSGAIVRFRNVAGLTGMVLAFHGAGRTSEAERLGRRFIDDPDEAPRVAGGVLRALALAAGPDGGGIDLARRSVGLLEDGPARLDHAYAVVALGELLRRGGVTKEARDVLREGLDLAVRCGATALADRAREELTSAGARPRRDALTGAASLTGTERRVADLAIRGLSNPEIAQALFISRKTVEKHLVSVFAKLGITTRADLGERLRH